MIPKINFNTEYSNLMPVIQKSIASNSASTIKAIKKAYPFLKCKTTVYKSGGTYIYVKTLDKHVCAIQLN